MGNRKFSSFFSLAVPYVWVGLRLPHTNKRTSLTYMGREPMHYWCHTKYATYRHNPPWMLLENRTYVDTRARPPQPYQRCDPLAVDTRQFKFSSVDVGIMPTASIWIRVIFRSCTGDNADEDGCAGRRARVACFAVRVFCCRVAA